MTHRLTAFLVLLAAIGTARGQTAYSYRYWFDGNVSTLKTGSAQGEATLEADISALAKGSVHSLHFQGHDADNHWSPVRTTFFFIPNTDTQSVKARYWLDDNDAAATTTATPGGTIDLDISHLSIGTHAVHYQTYNAAGEASPVRTTYFYMDVLQPATLTCHIWIDDNQSEAQAFPLTDEDITMEAEDLSVGMHDLHAAIYDDKGRWLTEGTVAFEVKAPMAVITLTATVETFSFHKDLDFDGVEGLRAYTATGFHKQTGDVMMSRVTDVPAGEGLLLVGAKGTYEVPVATSYSYYANLLVGLTETTLIAKSADGYDNYLLSQSDGTSCFVPATDGTTIEAGRAYLHIPGSLADGKKSLKISFDDNPDGIKLVPQTSGEEDGIYYDVAGRRLSKPTKGINIHRGRKIVVK